MTDTPQAKPDCAGAVAPEPSRCAAQQRNLQCLFLDRHRLVPSIQPLISARVFECRNLIEATPDEDLSRPVAIQGYDVDVRGALFHAVEHMSYHTGQILYIVKTLTSEHETFDFYSRHREE